MAEILTLDSPRIGHSTPATIGRNAALTIGATAMVAIAAHVAVPLFFTPVPLTLQTLAVLFLGLLLGPRWAFATLVLYLAEGAIGLPVFNPHGPGGLMQLLGPTGGYLLSYPFAAALAGLLCRMFTGQIRSGAIRFAAALAAASISSVLILAAGATWLAVVTRQPAHAILAQAVLPFLPGDAIKVCLAASAFVGCSNLMATGSKSSPVLRPERNSGRD